MLVNEIGCRLARAEDELQPAPALALGADFAAADEVALGDDADELAGCVDHRKAADMPLQHEIGGIDDGGVGCDRDDRTGS